MSNLSSPAPTVFRFQDPVPTWEQDLFIAIAVMYTTVATALAAMWFVRRHSKIISVRMPIVMYPAIMYGAWLVDVTCVSYIYGKTPLVCGLLSYSYLLHQTLFSLPYVLSFPTIVLADRLNKLKVEYNQGGRHWYWSFRFLLRPAVRAGIISCCTALIVVIYAAVKYSGAVLPGGEDGTQPPGEEVDCFRLSLIHNTAFGLVWLVVMMIFSMEVMKVADPYFTKYELLSLTNLNAPVAMLGMVYAIAPQVFPLGFDIRYWFIVTAFMCMMVAIGAPVVLSYDGPAEAARRFELRIGRALRRGAGSESKELGLEISVSSELTQAVDPFAAVLDNQVLLQAFTDFLVLNWCVENVLFYCEARNFEEGFELFTAEERVDRARKIVAEFVQAGAPLEINLEYGTRNAIVKAVQAGNLAQATFQTAQRHIFELMKKDSFLKWQNTPDYKKALKQASKQRGAQRSQDRSASPNGTGSPRGSSPHGGSLRIPLAVAPGGGSLRVPQAGERRVSDVFLGTTSSNEQSSGRRLSASQATDPS